MFFVWFGSLGFFFNVVLEIWVIEYAFFEYDTVVDDEFIFEFEDAVILEVEKGVAFGWEVYGSEGEGERESEGFSEVGLLEMGFSVFDFWVCMIFLSLYSLNLN